jgi:hypothetical protein
MDADLRLEREGGRCVDSMNIEPPHEPRGRANGPNPGGVATVGWLIAIAWATAASG